MRDGGACACMRADDGRRHAIALIDYGHAPQGARSSRARTLLQPMARRNEAPEERLARKAAQRADKQSKRLQRAGLGDPTLGQKDCTLCGRGRDLLIRC